MFGGSFSQNIKAGQFVLKLRVPLYVCMYTYMHICTYIYFYFYRIPVCINMFVYASVCISCAFSCLVILSHSNLFILILFYIINIIIIPIWFLTRDRKGIDFNGRGCGEELGGVRCDETIS